MLMHVNSQSAPVVTKGDSSLCSTNPPNQMQVSIKTYGMPTARFCAMMPIPHHDPSTTNDNEMYIPLNSNIVRVSMNSQGDFVHCFEAHTDVVQSLMCVREGYGDSPALALTFAFNGEVSSWRVRKHTWDMVNTVQVPGTMWHAALSFDRTRVVVLTSNDQKSLSIVSVQSDGSLSIDASIPLHGSNEELSRFAYVSWTQNDNVLVIDNEKTRLDKGSRFDYDLVMLDGHDLSEIRRENVCGPPMTMAAHCIESNEIVVATVGRECTVYDMDTLVQKWKVDVPGSGRIGCLLLDESGKFMVHSEGDREILEMGMDGPTWRWRDPSLQGYCFSMQWGAGSNRKKLWAYVNHSLHVLERGSDDIAALTSVTAAKLSCCGVELSPCRKFAAVGDLTGTVLLWPVESRLCKPSAHASVQLASGVRSMAWKQTNGHTHLLVGCMGGELYAWDTHTTSEPVLIAFLDDTVTCIQWMNGDCQPMAAASTTRGEVFLLDIRNLSNKAKIVSRKLAHVPSSEDEKQDLRFGSLHRFAEVWSVVWSPDNTSFATASEDQTVVIWNVEVDNEGNPKGLVQECILTGHTMAVTCVDWQETRSGVKFISCSDDKSLRVYDPKTWELEHVFSTYTCGISHTITYAALETKGTRVAACTLSGFLIIWDTESREEVYKKRIHNGSIEGLKWRVSTKPSQPNGVLTTCASDCTVNVVHVDQISSAL